MVELHGKYISDEFFALSKAEFIRILGASQTYMLGKTQEEKEKILGDCWESVNKKTKPKKALEQTETPTVSDKEAVE